MTTTADWHNRRYKEGRDYYMVGNGWITGLIQIDRSGPGAPLALIVQDPNQFGLGWCQKPDTPLFDAEVGFEQTQLTLHVDDRPFTPYPSNLTAAWQEQGLPIVETAWWGSFVKVQEVFYADADGPILYRKVTVTNRGHYSVEAKISADFMPNHRAGFSAVTTDASGQLLQARNAANCMGLTARADSEAAITANITKNAQAGAITVAYSCLSPGQSYEVVFAYILADTEQAVQDAALSVHLATNEQIIQQQQTRIAGAVELGTQGADVLNVTQACIRGLLATPSRKGRANAGIWQYNAEWVRDSGMIGLGCACIGLTTQARQIYERILSSLISPDGITCVMGRFDDVDFDKHQVVFTGGFPQTEHEQLDQTGMFLYALNQYRLWTGDTELIVKYWDKVEALAKRLINAPSRNGESGLYHNEREYWERNAFEHGIKEGYELAYQIWPILGLRAMQKLAPLAPDGCSPQFIQQCLDAAQQTHDSLLSGKMNMVHEGILVKRRLLDGTIQETTEHTADKPNPLDIPLGSEKISLLQPCSSMALPIAYGLIAPDDPIAAKTLDAVETLWNLRWDMGGYDRYHTSSECDTPGPWPFASLFIARANHIAGKLDRSEKLVHWLNTTQGGRAGAWHEHVPLTKTQADGSGIVPWIWGEIAILVTQQILGVKPQEKSVRIQPRLFPSMGPVKATITVRGKQLELELDANATQNNRCRFKGDNWTTIGSEGVELPL